MTNATYDRESLLAEVSDILQTMTADWDIEQGEHFTKETKLIADLMFESIDIVQFIVAIEERFQRSDLPFERLLMADGRYVEELTVDEVLAFLSEQLASSA